MTDAQFSQLMVAFTALHITLVVIGLGVVLTLMMQGTRIYRELHALRNDVRYAAERAHQFPDAFPVSERDMSRSP